MNLIFSIYFSPNLRYVEFPTPVGGLLWGVSSKDISIFPHQTWIRERYEKKQGISLQVIKIVKKLLAASPHFWVGGNSNIFHVHPEPWGK